jgi:hypothetical protein
MTAKEQELPVVRDPYKVNSLILQPGVQPMDGKIVWVPPRAGLSPA